MKNIEGRKRETNYPLQQAQLELLQLEHQEDTEKAERSEESHKDDSRKIRKTCFGESSQRPLN